MNDSVDICQGNIRLRLDCRHYLGDRPCAKGCEGTCSHYEPMGTRILIIKLGALGDVIRTEALLPGLKRVYPQSQITWVTRASGCRMLANNVFIDRLLPFDAESLCHLQYEQFDLLISLDKEPGPAGLAMRVAAPDKRGIGLSECGSIFPLNEQAHDYFALGVSDELKYRHNQSSYQRLIYNAIGVPYHGERYSLFPSELNKARAREVFDAAGIADGQEVVGLNTGAGRAFANKTWSADRFIELAQRLCPRCDCRVVLLGGPQEAPLNDCIAEVAGPQLVHPGCDHEELDFAALVQRCSVVLTGDTTAMHVGIALQVPTVVLFGPTCPQEIDLYGRGIKLLTTLDCAPCYRRHCDLVPNCMDMISVDDAYRALVHYLDRQRDLPAESERPREAVSLTET